MKHISAGQGEWTAGTAGDDSERPGTIENGRGWVRTVGDCGGQPGIGEDGRGLWGTAAHG